MNTPYRIERDSAIQLFAAAIGWDPNSQKERDLITNLIKNILELELADASVKNPFSVANLEAAIIIKANDLHSHKFKSNSKEEALDALKFLELFSLFGYYKTQVLDVKAIGLQGKYKDKDPLVEKSLFYAEQLRVQLDLKKTQQKIMKNEVKELESKITKIMSRRVTPVDQLALQKYVEKALGIVKSYVNS
jgi:hypothetical protein